MEDQYIFLSKLVNEKEARMEEEEVEECGQHEEWLRSEGEHVA